jgi:hypothetical protein
MGLSYGSNFPAPRSPAAAAAAAAGVLGDGASA